MKSSIGRALALLAVVAFPVAAQGGRKAAGPALAVIPQSQLEAVAHKAKVLRAEPATLRVRVGQRIALDSITVTVFDAGGRALGHLKEFDFAIRPGEAAQAVPRVITGVRVGTADLVVRYPRTWWKQPGNRPETKVKVVVTP